MLGLVMPCRVWQNALASIWVGSAEDAVSAWAGDTGQRIVNCAHQDYPYNPSCLRRWLHLNFRRTHEHSG